VRNGDAGFGIDAGVYWCVECLVGVFYCAE
jgi:hypothetical protein